MVPGGHPQHHQPRRGHPGRSRRLPGPKHAPAKDAERDRILQLCAEGHSIDEIAATLRTEQIPLNRTGISEVMAPAAGAGR